MEQRELGGTGIKVGRIGISSSFGAGEAVFDEALERGCNYFTWGTFIKGRSAPMKTFLKQRIAAGQRSRLVIGLLSYSHTVTLGDYFLKQALRQLGTDYLDCLLLGYFSSPPPERLLAWGEKLKAAGTVRALGITTHNRQLVPALADQGVIDLFHIRYNAVHRGAENDIFPHLPEERPGLVSFTATCWGKMLKPVQLAGQTCTLPAGDCYRFVLARPEIDCCMMGVKDQAALQENLARIEAGPLSTEELEHIGRIGANIAA